MAYQYPNTIRHRKAFAAWYEEGRKVTDKVLAAAGRKARQTVYEWAEAENWQAFAAECDRLISDVMQRNIVEITERHLQRVDTLLEVQSTIVATAQSEVVERYDKRASVDVDEVKSLVTAVKGLVDAGATHLNLRTVKVEHSGTVNVVTDAAAEAERIRTQRQQWKQEQARA